jgi:hypothetical protein
MPRDFDEESDTYDEENYDDMDSDSTYLSDFGNEMEEEEIEEEAEDIEQLYDHMFRSEALINILLKKGIVTSDELEKERTKVESSWIRKGAL